MKTLACLSALALAAASHTTYAEPTNTELLELIKKQQAEIDELKQEQEETDKKVEATADALETGSSTAGSKSNEWASKTKIGGYGEHHYNNFKNGDDQIDAHRFVLYISHEFTDKIRFFSELELEHGLAGDGKPGEIELEQAFIQWDFAENTSLVAGQYLIPVGILNETHEPDTFFGVERNAVEKNIIPTTWWETGALIHGQYESGLSYDVAFHSGLENDSANIRSGRQKSAKAIANDFAYTGRVKYRGIRGLELSATYQYQENMSQGEFEQASANLFETHAIYEIKGFELRALYAEWSLDGEEAKDLGRDKQQGYYLEPSYTFNEKIGLFARYSNWNNSVNAEGSEDSEAIDVGLNFWLHPQVVFKFDYSQGQGANDQDSLNLGLGWSF
ncbi:hypothetical protein SAMN02745866_03118 [Alteromonadaceae bacterium Bs31]|nr:hypothetical protein SAMN02745866_03118 [Alteromonadaceae bacterium Bs31]